MVEPPTGQPVDRSSEPSAEEVAGGVVDLLAEVDTALSSSRWAFLDTGSDNVKYRLYEAAALRHCCLLLEQMVRAMAADLDLSVRILGRAHLEAWLYAMYLHFGKNDALTRMAQDTVRGLEISDQANKRFDEQLAKEKKKAKKRFSKVLKANAGISRWNAEHPDLPPKRLLKNHTFPSSDLLGST